MECQNSQRSQFLSAEKKFLTQTDSVFLDDTPPLCSLMPCLQYQAICVDLRLKNSQHEIDFHVSNAPESQSSLAGERAKIQPNWETVVGRSQPLMLGLGI
jgi:hypothetical protein